MKGRGRTGLYVTLAIILAVGGVTGYYILTPKNTPESPAGVLDGFAKCITEKGVTMYGAYWCPHCQNQKSEFGKSWEFVKYVECSLPNRAGQTRQCKDKNIGGYPTWEFADGSRIEGEATIQQLAQKTGCTIRNGDKN